MSTEPAVVFVARLEGRYEFNQQDAAWLLKELDALAECDTGIGHAAADMASRIRRFNIDLISVDQRSPEDAALARSLDHLHQQAAWLSHDAERLRAYLSSTGPSYRLRDGKGNDLGTFASSTGPYAPGDRIVFGRKSEWIVDAVEGDTLTLRGFGAVS